MSTLTWNTPFSAANILSHFPTYTSSPSHTQPFLLTLTFTKFPASYTVSFWFHIGFPQSKAMSFPSESDRSIPFLIT